MKTSNANDRLTHRIHTRITQKKYEELSQLLTQSRNVHSHSELLRYLLDNRPIIIRTRNDSLDKVMQELGAIRRELQAIGGNINQITRHFHTQDLPTDRLEQAQQLIGLIQPLTQKIDELFLVIAKVSEPWLAE